MEDITTFSGPAAGTKGGRGYVQGGDILTEVEAICAPQNGIVTEVKFLHPLTTRGVLCLGDAATGSAEVCAHGTMTLDGRATVFEVVAGLQPLASDRPYDEFEIDVSGDTGDGLTVTPTPPHSTMEHVLRGVKAMARLAVDVDRKWWFARLSDKRAALPDIAHVTGLNVYLASVIAGRMVKCHVLLNNVNYCTVEFVGKNT